MALPILQVEGVHKRFRKHVALKDVSFEVYEGEIFCLLGPNGAGKSTTMNILSTALQADRGTVSFDGVPVEKDRLGYKASLGIVPQDLAIYEEIPARANVAFFASLYGLRGKALRDSVQRALQFVGLVDRQHDKPSTFSGGMKRRLNIACAIAHRPRLIMMDEPTVGIDPQSRTHILDSIKTLRDAGATILYTTHYMEEVEAIASRIVIVDHGEIIAEGTKEQLKETVADGRIYTIECDNGGRIGEGIPDAVVDELYGVEGVKSVDVQPHRIDITVTPGIENLDKIIGILLRYDVKIRNLTTSTASLETVFLHLTGRRLRN